MSAKSVTKKLSKRGGRKIGSVTIVGRRWFNGGSTYFSSEIYVDGHLVHKIPFDYGYGQMYEQAATEWLIKNGFIKAEPYKSGGYPPLWRLAEDNGFHQESTVTDVTRKRDL